MNNTQKHLIIYITRDVVRFISQEYNLPVDAAMEDFFESRVFEKLQDIESGLYTESASYVYEEYKTERDSAPSAYSHST
jgi:Na+-transporting NADH:ubiquinone oxidoreductase subunit NqrC